MAYSSEIEGEEPAHDIVWHSRRWFAAGAVAFIVFLVVAVACLFAGGPSAMEFWVQRWSFFVNPVVWLVALPLVYRRMR